MRVGDTQKDTQIQCDQECNHKNRRVRYQTMKRKIKFENGEIKIIIMALIELRNRLMAEGRYTDAVDELIIKFS